MSPAELCRTEFYGRIMRPCGATDELKLRLPDERLRAGVGVLGDHRFTERDRLVLDLLGPHLARARERGRAERLRRADVDLTEREWEVLEWVARGKTNKEVADLMLLAPDTVRKHLENAFAKLGAHTRTEAVARAFRSRGD